MIRNKKEIEEKLIERLTQKAKEYVKNMDEKSNGEYYPIDVIEKDLVDIQKVSQELRKKRHSYPPRARQDRLNLRPKDRFAPNPLWQRGR